MSPKPAADLRDNALHLGRTPSDVYDRNIGVRRFSRVFLPGRLKNWRKNWGESYCRFRMAGTAPFAHIEPTPAASTMCGG